MLITYSPKGEAPQTFEFDLDDLNNREAEALEDCGLDVWSDFGGWWARLLGNNIRARRALLWLLLRRKNPDLDFDDVTFRLGELEIEDEPEPTVGKDEPSESATDSLSPQPA